MEACLQGEALSRPTPAIRLSPLPGHWCEPPVTTTSLHPQLNARASSYLTHAHHLTAGYLFLQHFGAGGAEGLEGMSWPCSGSAPRSPNRPQCGCAQASDRPLSTSACPLEGLLQTPDLNAVSMVTAPRLPLPSGLSLEPWTCASGACLTATRPSSSCAPASSASKACQCYLPHRPEPD